MKLIQRIGYYLGGFSIGLIILAFFLNGKKTSCAYGLDARVLKNIRTKKVVYSPEIANAIQIKKLDTTEINYIFLKGDVDFSKSDTRKKPCGLYFLEGKINSKHIGLTVKNCDSIATILKLENLN
ncbi:MAG: hypothetical protein ACPG6B_09250 [Oceanihabitans sp.]